MVRYFGTDGIRARAGVFPLDYNSVYGLGRALVSLAEEEGLSRKFLLGRDTRESGGWLETAFVHGVQDAGGTALCAGVVPTSAVSLLVKKHGFSAGVVISASHNPYQDNGIKLFSSKGRKIDDDWERRLERALASPPKNVQQLSQPAEVLPSLAEEYLDFLRSKYQGAADRRPLKVVLDCANGASSHLAPPLFRELGFAVEAMACAPDGRNINDGCGSLHPQALARKVTASGADLGVAFDGDADRAVWVDERGRLLNGDHTLFVQAAHMKSGGRLKGGAVVATLMSNLGLEKALDKLGIHLVRAAVGDRFVLDKMTALGANLGGEQSGHTIFLDDCPTGDGLLTALKMLEVMVERGDKLSELVRGFVEWPQLLLNVPVAHKADLQTIPEITDTMALIREMLKNSGRLEVRYSGTEPLVRVMVEGENKKQVEELARRMADVLVKHLGHKA
jgi:phosphoglucosamine mutase